MMARKKPKPTIITENGKTTIRVTIDVCRVARGHRPHLSGAGKHDSQTNRLRTRANKNSQAIKDSLQ
jgi:hypothetical protein